MRISNLIASLFCREGGVLKYDARLGRLVVNALQFQHSTDVEACA